MLSRPALALILLSGVACNSIGCQKNFVAPVSENSPKLAQGAAEKATDPSPATPASTPAPAAPSIDSVAAGANSRTGPQDLRADPPLQVGPTVDHGPAYANDSKKEGPALWGLAGVRGFPIDDQIAPNGLEYHALFSLDFNLNLWLWREERLYLFSDTRFWGQRATPGVTNPSQGAFDFSKREFDFDMGFAWNYWGSLEARAFAYSFNNLNRGSSMNQPTGYTDGVGLENRWYVGGSYPDLGTPEFDVARANFLSAGYYPTKDMVDAEGNHFHPGPFVRAYLTQDLWVDWFYAYADVQLIATHSSTPRLLSVDAGLAVRPIAKLPRLEFRLGGADIIDVQQRELERSIYGAIRLIF